MVQVVRTTNDVITNALYLIGELGTDENPDAFMLETGLDLLNEIIDKFSSDSIYIPFLTTLNFTMVPGKASYTIADVIAGADIRADRINDLSFATYVVAGSGGGVPPTTVTFTANSTTNSIAPTGGSANYLTGTPVTMVAGTGGLLPAPIVSGQTYWTITVDSANIRLATTQANAFSNVPIVLTSNGLPPNLITISGQVQPFPVGQGATSLTYPVRIISKAEYYNVVRQNGLVARPGFVFLDKQANNSIITYYPAPAEAYPATIQVKSFLDSLDNQETLGELPPYYYGFLKYALARKFILYYPSGNWPQTAEEEYQDYFNNLKNANETDLTIRPSVTLTAPEPFYWANILSY